MFFTKKKTRKLNNSTHDKFLTTAYITQLRNILLDFEHFYRHLNINYSSLEEGCAFVFRQEAPIRLYTVNEKA
jgi:hypothetical protein